MLPLVIGLVGFLSGCVATALTASPEQLAGIRGLTVVPVEPPPLSVPPAAIQSVGLEIVKGMYPLTAVPVPQIQSGARVLTAAGGVILLVQVLTEELAAGTPTGEPHRLEPLPDSPDIWMPTAVLRDEVAAQLRAGASLSPVSAATTYLRLDIAERGPTSHIQNWLKPIRAWYSAETSDVTYDEARARNDIVLEVGLLNFELAGGKRFVIQVVMRLVDPRTGGVIGRSRDWAYPKMEARELLAGDAARLKEAFTSITRPLVASCLGTLGLVAADDRGK